MNDSALMDMDPLQLGFKVDHFFWPPRLYKVLRVGSDVPFIEQKQCPSDGTILKTLCTLVAKEDAMRVRIGCCDSCGYIGYVDRPERRWMYNFYFNVWDRATSKDIEREVERYGTRAGKGHPQWLKEALVGLDTNRRALEIGCGYGETLKGMEILGFARTDLLGTENSLHRAEIAQRAHGIRVFSTPFEDESTLRELKKMGPFSYIYSYHVLEHMQDPAEVIRQCSHLQKEGDYLALALPNAVGEESGSLLLYLPHLHSFTPRALEQLLNRNSYMIRRDASTPRGNFVVAQKVHERIPITLESGHFENMVEKFVHSLALEKKYKDRPRILWWFRSMDFGAQMYVWHRLIASLQWIFFYKIYARYRYKEMLIAVSGKERYLKHTQHVSTAVGLLVRNLKRRFSSVEESPLEIQFEGDIQFLYK